MSAQPSTQYYHHGRFRVAGGVLPDGITAYRTYGEPMNPCIVFPTCYGGKLDSGFTSPKCFFVLMLKLPFHNIIFRPIVHGRRWKGMSYMRLNRLSSSSSHGQNSQVMDPKKYFIVTFALFSNGEVCDLPYRKLNGLFLNC